MKNRALVIPILILIFFIMALPYEAVAETSGQTVHVISLQGEINPATSAYLTKEIERANLAKADGIVIEISTLGGLVTSALEMKEAILDSEVPVVAFVKDRAASAGALITIAADTIIMAPGSHMGAAEPIPYSEKSAAFISGEFRSTAEKNGRNGLIAAGMVDKNLDVPGFPVGTLVDITASQAKELGYADAVLDTVPDALNFMGWGNAQVIEVGPDYKLQMAQFLTRQDVASILLTIGMIAIVAEIFIPGFGVAGVIGIISFALYFGGGFLAGNTEWWSLLLFIIGIILFLIELAIPGFGAFGISGIIAMITGIIFAANDPISGIKIIGIALLATIVAIPILYKFFGGDKVFRHLVLEESETVDKGYVNIHNEEGYNLLGKTGEAVTPLRPSGTIIMDGRRMDVVSDGSFLPQGSLVKVVKVEGSRIVVSELS